MLKIRLYSKGGKLEIKITENAYTPQHYEKSQDMCIISLDEFKKINSVSNMGDVFYPLQTVNTSDSIESDLEKMKHDQLNNEEAWLIEASQVIEDTATVLPVSLTAHHEGKARDQSENINTINVPLPLIDYKSSTIELQFHLMKIAVEYTQYLNPGQVAVGCSDQPLYALKKMIQWAHPDLFLKYFCFMGGLHIEQTALVCVVQLITGSGMEDIVSYASLDTIGLKTAVCDVNNIKKARYTLQVIAVVLMRKLQDAYKVTGTSYDNMEHWIAAHQNCPMFMYWYNVLRHIK